MKATGVLLVGLAFVSVVVAASEYLMNDTGETALGLRVTFSDPVTITSFGDSLTSLNPIGISDQFVFSVGEVEAWGGQWLSWEPATALILDYEWLQSVPGRRSVEHVACHRDDAARRVLSFVPDPDVKYHCDGDEDWSNAEFWGQPGHQVRDVELVFEEGVLEVTVGLHPSDALGRYRYHIEFRLDERNVYINLDPAARAAEIVIATPDDWSVRARYERGDLAVTPTSVGVQFPLSAFSDSDVACRLPLATPSFHISYNDNGRRELFFFPSTAAGGLFLKVDPELRDAAPLTPALNAPMRGVHIGGSFSYWNGASNLVDLPEEYFLYLKRLNVDWVGIGPAGGGLQGSWDTGFPGLDTDEELVRRLIRKLHSHGFNVYVMVSTWFWHFGEAWPHRANLGAPSVFDWARFPGDDSWPWDPLHPRHEIFVEEFFQSYTTENLRLAELCEEEGVEMLALGTETDWLFRTRNEFGQLGSEFSDELRRMMKQVREVYTGLLTYDLSYTVFRDFDLRENSLEMWGDLSMDVIGLSMYPQLFEIPVTGVPSVEVLKERWQRIFDGYFVPLKERYPDKPIVFTEFGFINAVGTTYKGSEIKGPIEPTTDSNANGIDDGEEEQANAFEALFLAMEENPGIVEGVFIWGQWIQTVEEWSTTLAHQRDHWVRGRRAQKVLCEYYGKWSGLSSQGVSACCACPEGAESSLPIAREPEEEGKPESTTVTQLRPAEELDCPVLFPSSVSRGGHYGHIRDISFSPDGSLLATAGYDQYCRLFSISEEAFTGQAFRHPRLIMGVEFSPDGRMLATAGSDQLVRIWDVQENKLLRTLVGHPYYVRSISFSPDGRTIASAGAESSVRVWDVATGQEKIVLWDHASWGDIAFSPTGEHLVGGAEGGAVFVWDTDTYEHVATLEGHEDFAYTVEFAETGNILATGDRSGRVKLWSWPDGRSLHTLEEAKGWVFALDPTGSVLVCADSDSGVVGIWSTETGERVREITPSARVMALAFAPGETTVTASLANGQLESWDAFTGQRLLALPYHTDFITGLSAEAGAVITASWDGHVLRWDGSAAGPLLGVAVDPSPVLCMDASPVLRVVAIGREDGTVELVDAENGTMLWSETVSSSGVLSVKWIEDGKTLAWGSGAGIVGTVLAASPFDNSELLSVSRGVFAIAQSPKTGDLALGLSDGTIALVALSGTVNRELAGHRDSVYALAFDISGDQLYSGGRDGAIRVWDPATGEGTRVTEAHEGSVYDLQPIESLGVIVSASSDTTLKAWDMESAACVATLRGHSSGVTAIAWDEERETLISAGKGDLYSWSACSLVGEPDCPQYPDPRAASEHKRAVPQFDRPRAVESEDSGEADLGALSDETHETADEHVGAEEPFFLVSTEKYPQLRELALDGMSEASVPLNWWYTFDEKDSGPDFHSANPISVNGEQFVRYSYPEDGDVGFVAAQFASLVDVSEHEALILVAKASEPVHAAIELSFCDCNLPAEEDCEPCGGSTAVFPVEIPLDTETRVAVIPLSGFVVHPWVVESISGASSEVDLSRVWEVKIAPLDECTLHIYRVAVAEEVTRVLFDEYHDESNTLSLERAVEIRPDHPEWHLYSEFEEELSLRYVVDRGTQALTPEYLAGYDVLILSVPQRAFAAGELQSIRDFVYLGGGLFLMGRFASANRLLNPIAEEFGFRFLEHYVIASDYEGKPQEYLSRQINDQHPVMSGIDAVFMDWPSGIEVTGDAVVLFSSGPDTWLDLDNDEEKSPGDPDGPFTQAVAVTYGDGRVVAIADDQFTSFHLYYPRGATLPFLLNVLEWLAGSGESL